MCGNEAWQSKPAMPGRAMMHTRGQAGYCLTGNTPAEIMRFLSRDCPVKRMYYSVWALPRFLSSQYEMNIVSRANPSLLSLPDVLPLCLYLDKKVREVEEIVQL